MPARIGLIFLDDLCAFAPWISDRAPSWAASRELDGPLLPPTFAPPPVLVVVARSLTWARLEDAAPWLAEADALILVVDPRDDPGHDEDDPELRELAGIEREQLRAQLGALPLEFVDVSPAQPLEQAIDAALTLARARASSCTRSWPTLAPTPTFEPTTASEAGPWIAWTPPGWRRPICETNEALRHLAAGLGHGDGRPFFLDGLAGVRVDLRTGAREHIDGLAGSAQPGWPIAAAPGGGWLDQRRAPGDARPSWTLHRLGHPAQACGGGWGRAIAIDPGGRVAWTGGRCHFDWRVITARGPAWWTASSHDWPCGHAKKLYGFENNEPLTVQLAADLGACASTYEHDSLLTPGLPLRWRELGELCLAERARGEPRALLFVRADGEDGFPGDPMQADEDARDAFAPLSLGPSPALRYVVGLEAPTYRLAGGAVERLGPTRAGAAEWIVCDAEHRVVHRAPGRMLAGWGPWLVIQHNAQLWRVDLRTRAQTPLGPSGRPIAGAVAIVGTPMVVLLGLEPTPALRLV
ncbi:hypothetical protein G6O69_18590 [Pseudenhygromyxa sp. WMMC2535]|uniref:hypothetical protein n=1 Tax=Pseudenhygromyxa sp. WMMC2535 TaxID=2712867 RepID=UPI001555D4B8|nr:hypothetical protein [Pseudenhygromyxa sp. WMMC2535]NVB39858.1 hypothetical protein [Pseudenhygromyxa sp. WMMC2535]